jgi:glycosyltransferase involved in cell wall biosynthesis
MKISVILCTYNRCQSLVTALESVAASRLSDSVDWEVLVVDNNSKDQTRKVVEEFIACHPGRFRYFFEAKQGKSHALNTGIRESSGDVVAFMDDDVVVDAVWLHTLTAVLQRSEWSGVGGRILPERSFEPPEWLALDRKYALAPLAIFDLGPRSGELFEAPFGTNMAFRREVFVKIGGFRTDLGPCPGSEIRGEDTEFGDRALAAQLRLWYQPSAIVYHSLNAERLTKRYFLAWWFDKARSDLRQDGVPSNLHWRVSGVPIALLARLCAWFVRWMSAFRPAHRFSCKLSLWKVAATIVECRRLHLLSGRGESATVPEVDSSQRMSAK